MVSCRYYNTSNPSYYYNLYGNNCNNYYNSCRYNYCCNYHYDYYDDSDLCCNYYCDNYCNTNNNCCYFDCCNHYNNYCCDINSCCNINNSCCAPGCCYPCCSTIPCETIPCITVPDNLLEAKITKIAREEYDFFLNKANVVGVGFGLKTTGGYVTEQKCILVYVSKKLPSDQILPQDLIPDTYKCIPTDVAETGVFQLRNGLNGLVRPALGGVSISAGNSNKAGTLGCLVQDSTSVYLLSTNHALANSNQTPIGTPVIQPALSDGGTLPSNVIANLSNYIPLKFSIGSVKCENTVDCAIAKITDITLVNPKIAILNTTPQGVIAPTLNIAARKVGKTSELTTGIIDSYNTTIMAGGLLFLNQIVVTTQSMEGDSGAVLMDIDNNALGILVAGSDTTRFSFYSSMQNILNQLNVSLVTIANN